MDCTICGLQLNVTEVRTHQQICRKDEVDVEMAASERSQVEMSEYSEVISFFFHQEPFMTYGRVRNCFDYRVLLFF